MCFGSVDLEAIIGFGMSMTVVGDKSCTMGLFYTFSPQCEVESSRILSRTMNRSKAPRRSHHIMLEIYDINAVAYMQLSLHIVDIRRTRADENITDFIGPKPRSHDERCACGTMINFRIGKEILVSVAATLG